MDDIFKALRLVPDFDGNSNVLTRFIKLCDQLVAKFVTPENNLINLALINGILNKITGPAARLINSNGIPDTWLGIRTALVNNFSDQRDETSLYNDLALLTQGSSTPQEYYEKCQNIFSTLMTYISLHETIPTTIEAKRDLYKKLTLQAFLRGLKDPLGSRIRCMRPETIEKALEFVHDEMNIIYMQDRNDSHTDRRNHHKINNNFNMPGTSRSFNPPQPPPQFWQHRPQNNMWQPRPMFNQNQGPSRTQQIFRALPPNFNPQSNVFRIPNRNNFSQNNFAQNNFGQNNQNNNNFNNNQSNRPVPMSGVSHFTPKPLPLRGHDWTKQGNPPPSNYFKSRQLNLNECYDQTYDDPYMYYDPNEYEYYYAEPVEYPYDYYYDQPPLPMTENNISYENSDSQDTESQNQNFQKTPKSDKPR